MNKTILSGHTSEATAYVVADYPYGFRLRCQIRYWLEFKAGKGCRLWSQTTNPKRPGTVWNKAKASTYGDVAGAMYLDDKGHVQWSALGHYPEAAAVRAWLAEYSFGLCEGALKAANLFLVMKVNYERAKATGMPYQYAGMVASLAARGLSYEEALARVNVGWQKAQAVIAQQTAIANGATGAEAALYSRPEAAAV